MPIDFDKLRALIQHDIGNRGLAKVSNRNLLTVCPGDLDAACRSIVETPNATLAVVTGFFIPHAKPPAGETDGPLGAVFLARALFPLGIRVLIAADAFAVPALEAGIAVCGLRKEIAVLTLPGPREAGTLGPDAYRKRFLEQAGGMPTHLLALERVGPSHTLESLQRQLGPDGALGETYLDFVDAVPDEHQNRCHTMRGLDVTDRMSPAHWLFETRTPVADAPDSPGEPGASATGAANEVVTLAVGDGGNEIGMGKIPWDILHANIPNGGLIACRVPTQRLIVCGISNWGAYALAAGIYGLLGKTPAPSVFHADIEQRILKAMVDKGPLVDGVLGKPSVSVDGVSWKDYAAVLTGCGDLIK